MGGLELTTLDRLRMWTELRALSLANVLSVDDFAPLGALAELRDLDLSGTRVRNLGPLRSLTQLETLRLRGTYAADLSPLQALPNLRHIDAAYAVPMNWEVLATSAIESGRAVSRDSDDHLGYVRYTRRDGAWEQDPVSTPNSPDWAAWQRRFVEMERFPDDFPAPPGAWDQPEVPRTPKSMMSLGEVNSSGAGWSVTANSCRIYDWSTQCQDTLASWPEHAVFAVFHNTESNGEFLGRVAGGCIDEVLKERSDTIVEAVERGVDLAMRRLAPLFWPDTPGTPDWDITRGTSGVTATFEGNKAHVTHVGDMGVYLFQDAKLHPLLPTQTVGRQHVKSGRVPYSALAHIPSFPACYFGMLDNFDVDVCEVELRPRDRLVVVDSQLTEVEQTQLADMLHVYKDDPFEDLAKAFHLRTHFGGQHEATLAVWKVAKQDA